MPHPVSLIQPDPPKSVDIGAIFGLDVGGTLSELIYFERRKAPRPHTAENFDEDVS
jgi:hypothetical protein